MKRIRPTATMETVLVWIRAEVFRVQSGEVFKGETKLTPRNNLRRNSQRFDFRVDLCHEKQKRSIHVSQLVWMANTDCPIPPGFEIHHRDENPENNDFENLICLHRIDHNKLHRSPAEENEIPF